MQNRMATDLAIEIQRSLAIRALRRSNVRRKITEYLNEISPKSSYTSEIAYSIGATTSNVIGALRGIHERYREDESLLELNLVEEKEGKTRMRLYGITPFGKEILQTFHSRR
jgi:uncharacterized protein